MSDISDWWSTEIIEMEPGSISLRGIPIKNLIGKKIPRNFFRGILKSKVNFVLECITTR